MAKYTRQRVSVAAETLDALQVTFHPDSHDEVQVWIPVSQIQNMDEYEDTKLDEYIYLEVSKWILKKNEIEYDPSDDVE